MIWTSSSSWCLWLAVALLWLHAASTTSSVSASIPSNHRISDKSFYIYESEEWNKIATASIYHRDNHERIDYQLNQGAGPEINITVGEFHTDQYQLFSMLYYRALKDPRRTLDPAKATSFLIPYDFALDSAYYKNCGRSNGVCYDFRKCPLAPKVEELLLNSSYFHRNQGRDHVLIIGMNYAMDHYILKPKCKSLISGVCSNCTKFAIDDYSYMYSDNKGILTRGDYWHAIPFPADFHWSRRYHSSFPWNHVDRPIVASYTGSDRSFYGPSRRLRSSIGHYCGLHPNECATKSYGLNGTRYSFRVEGHNPLHLSRASVFCFQPTGDLMTRKGLFDSIIQGCIPVVFDPLTAQVMYTWHWEEQFWNEVIIELNFHPTAHRYFDPVAYLIQLTKENQTMIQEKQRKIREKVFELQYGLDGYVDRFQYKSSIPYIYMTKDNSTIRPDDTAVLGKDGIYYVTRNATQGSGADEEVIHCDPSTWPKDATGKPMRDAYDITMDYVLGWHSGAWTRFRNATVPECWDGWLDKVQNRCRPDSEKPPKGK